jgi:hypothetical protein
MRSVVVRAAVVIPLLAIVAVAGCSGEPAPEPALSMPADVQAIIEARCISCHSTPPSYGAPMALTTYDALHASAVTAPARPVYALVGERIHDATRPMPPGAPLSASELATLDAWIAAGAPAGTGGGGGDAGTPQIQVGPEFLPCEPTHEFRAHAPGTLDQPYVVAPDAGNLTMCFAFASPFTDVEQGTAFAPIIDDPRVLHHWIIFGASSLPAGKVAGDAWESGTALTADSQFLTGWAPGGVNSVLPDDLGRELPGSGGFVILQVHYWNVAALSDVADRSGVALCSTQTPRIHEIGTSTLGSLNIAIPARANDHVVSGICRPAITEPVTIVASGPHMHTRGVSLRTEVYRGGVDGPMEMLVDVPRWDFNAQSPYPAPGGRLVIEPGDVIRTTCVYDNPENVPIYFGERTEDEMCFNFVSAYPAGALANELGRARRLCIE